jgi:hypothetical protein
MSLGDILTLVGIVVAIVAIGVPLRLKEIAARRRFSASIHYRLEESASTAALIARQVLDLETSTVQDIPDDLRVALVSVVKGQVREFLSALAEDAGRVEEHLKSPERRSAWHLMMANLRVAVDRDMSDPRSLAGTALQACCTAYIGLAVLELDHDRDEAAAFLRAAVQDEGGPGSRIVMFAQALLPENVLAEVVGPQASR